MNPDSIYGSDYNALDMGFTEWTEQVDIIDTDYISMGGKLGCAWGALIVMMLI